MASELKAKSCCGFTLVETIVYVAVVGLVVASVSSLTLGMVESYKLAKTKDELALAADGVFRYLFREIRNAQSIYLASSSLDTDPGALALKTIFQFGDELGSSGIVSFYLSAGRIFYKREGETPLALTAEDIEVTKFKFTRVTPRSGLEGVRFYFSFKDKRIPTATFTLTSFAVLRGGYLQ